MHFQLAFDREVAAIRQGTANLHQLADKAAEGDGYTADETAMVRVGLELVSELVEAFEALQMVGVP